MDRIAELQELIATAKKQRAQARKLRLQAAVTSCNYQLHVLGEELAALTK